MYNTSLPQMNALQMYLAAISIIYGRVGIVGIVAQYIWKTPVSDSCNVLQIFLTLFFLPSLMDL